MQIQELQKQARKPNIINDDSNEGSNHWIDLFNIRPAIKKNSVRPAPPGFTRDSTSDAHALKFPQFSSTCQILELAIMAYSPFSETELLAKL